MIDPANKNQFSTTTSAGFQRPFWVAAAPTGKIYITNVGANWVSVIDPANNRVTTILDASLQSPRGVAAAADGKV